MQVKSNGQENRKKRLNSNSNNTIYIYILFIFVAFSKTLLCQTVSEDDLKMALLKNLPEHIKWPAENKLDRFNIVLISNNENFINSFISITNNKTIKGKPISISKYTPNSFDINSTQMIFLDESNHNSYLDIFDKIEGHPILLVTEEFKDKRFVLINLFMSGKKMRFEINKSNIINQNLKIEDEILLIGGSIIDVAELYRESQQSLRSMEKLLEQNQIVYDSLMTKIEKSNKTIDGQADFILKQRKQMKKDQKNLKILQKEFDQQKILIDSQQSVLNTQHQSIFKQKLLLKSTLENIEKQKINIQQGIENLRNLESKLDSLNNEITDNQSVLNEQTIIITRQRNILIFSIIAIVIFLLLSTIIYFAFRSIKSKNMILSLQKTDIENMNEELQASNNELFEKNEEINLTLDQLKTTQKQLVQSEKMASLGILTAGIAHELNNPINFVYAGVSSITKDLEDILPILNEVKKLKPGMTDTENLIECIYSLAKKNNFNEAVDAIIQTVNDIKIGADRSTEIIKGLRNFSRANKEKLQIINIHNCISDVLVLLKNKYKNRININKQFDPKIPEIECNGEKINQAFMNIINNAIDAIPEKGNIMIKTELNNDYIRVIIRDDGIGISNENLTKVFDPFFTTKQVGKGIGLGLSITFAAINENNGNIEVNTELEKGTEFIVNLPVKQKLK